MNLKRVALLIVIWTAASRSAVAAPDPTTGPADAPVKSATPLDMLRALIGNEYRIDANWADGTPLKARAVWDAVSGKGFVRCRTYLPITGGEYCRYENIFGNGHDGLTDYNFTYDGSSKQIPMTINGNTIESSEVDGGVALKQSIVLAADGTSYQWHVTIRKGDEKEFRPLIDGTWIRQATIAPFGELKTPKPSSPPTTAESKLDVMTRYIGAWNVAAALGNGSPLKAQIKYEWGVGKRFVNADTMSESNRDSARQEQQLTIFGIVKDELTAFHFVPRGVVLIEPQTINGNRVESTRAVPDKNGNIFVQQYVEMLDDDSVRWKVWMKGAEEKLMIDAV